MSRNEETKTKLTDKKSGDNEVQSKEKLAPFTICVFGECGQGKSTLLNKLSEIYIKIDGNTSSPLVFKASKSLTTITSCVRIASSGNMTLIDTPGLNDPYK